MSEPRTWTLIEYALGRVERAKLAENLGRTFTGPQILTDNELDEEKREVIELEPVLDLLEWWLSDIFAKLPPDDQLTDTESQTVGLLRSHGRLKEPA